jgi:hypothetical protein
MAVRTLTDAEITDLVAEYCNIPPGKWSEICEPFLVADDSDAEEFHAVHWGYADKMRFLLEASQHGPLPN